MRREAIEQSFVGAVGRALVTTSGISYSMMRVNGSIWWRPHCRSLLEPETHPHLLLSIQEYKLVLFIDWGGQDRCLGSNIIKQTGTCWPWCPVPELRHTSVPLNDSG